ncbi:GntR family transcriptional regulator [Clostridium fermenticellae]|uniref:GntR family transcriptional regulator n=1 Tax=Clostridium fermenticellae TaxID=2068654 RepID=A0A386H3H3_9CLOT|nr:GntR family transcriptional regulator [Clostridium fermenticellae]AYD40206.1 GntR family transcriptional regulator [Clostridium fermenticellae]
MDYILSNDKPISDNEVYMDIRNRILRLELEPGQKISENQMSSEYSISRFVIRNAFKKLNQLGLITVYPQRGTYVSLIDLAYIEDLLVLRTAVEKEVLCEMFTRIEKNLRMELVNKLEENLQEQQAFKDMKSYEKRLRELDYEFHKIMVDSVKRYGLVKILNDPMIHIARWRNFDVAFVRKMPKLIGEHRKIIDAIREDNLNDAQQAIGKHLETNKKMIDMAKRKYPQYFPK